MTSESIIRRGREFSCTVCRRPVPDGAAVRVFVRRQIEGGTVTINFHFHRTCAESFQQAIGDALRSAPAIHTEEEQQ